MSFGLSIGMHPWFTDQWTNGGTITANTVNGAVVNLAIDGVRNVTVSGNLLSGPQGNPRCGGARTDYAIDPAETLTSSIDGGWVARDYNSCLP
jgi:hypothetical protein